MWREHVWRRKCTTLVVVIGGLFDGVGCGGRTDRSTLGGETGFLEACVDDAQCASGLCACGACSRTCDESSECGDNAVCGSASAACDGQEQVVCLRKEASSDAMAACSDQCSDASEATLAEGAPTSGERRTSEQLSNACDEFACLVELEATSPGTVDVKIEVDGLLCAPCGGSPASYYHASSGLPVPGAVHLCADECPQGVPPSILCNGPLSQEDYQSRAWDGRSGVFDATDTCDPPVQRVVQCQSEPTYAPAGRYMVRVCSRPTHTDAQGQVNCDDSGLDLVCTDVEFDFPSAEPVLVHLNNPPLPFEESTEDSTRSSDVPTLTSAAASVSTVGPEFASSLPSTSTSDSSLASEPRDAGSADASLN